MPQAAWHPGHVDQPQALTLFAPEGMAFNTAEGLGTDEVPAELPIDVLGPGQVAYDIVYRQEPTPWLRAAAARGARTVDGLGMLLHQGAAAFAQWTGTDPPVDAMRAGLTAR